MNTQQQIATTILQQLGGNRFVVMTGAKALCAAPALGGTRGYIGGLTFRLPRMSGVKARIVSIHLTGLDLYDLLAFDAKMKPVGSAKDLYAEDLIDAFESRTGVLAKLSGPLPQKGY